MQGRFEVDSSRLARQSLNVENWEEGSEDIGELGVSMVRLMGVPLALYSGGHGQQ